MSKAGNWVPIDKALSSEFKYITRSYSKIEAMFSHQMDVDCDRKWTIKGYAKLWGWSRNKVRKFLADIRTPEGHSVDTRGTHQGHPIHLIDKALWKAKDTLGTPEGHPEDTPPTPTSNPNPNPNPKPKKKTVRFTPPSLSEVKDYCLERKNNIDPERFLNHYEANGWMRGKNKIKSWKACVRTWEGNEDPQLKKERAALKPRANTVKQQQMQDLSTMIRASEAHDDKLRHGTEISDKTISTLPRIGTHPGNAESD